MAALGEKIRTNLDSTRTCGRKELWVGILQGSTAAAPKREKAARPGAGWGITVPWTGAINLSCR